MLREYPEILLLYTIFPHSQIFRCFYDKHLEFFYYLCAKTISN